MQVEGHNSKLAGEGRELTALLTSFLKDLVLVLIITVVAGIISLSPGLIATKSISDIASAVPRLVFFLASLLGFATVIVCIATLFRRENRDAIRLKEQLTEIYTIALQHSALNPQVKSLDSR